MFIAINWPEFVEANTLLSIALHFKFAKSQLHVSTNNELSKTCQPAVKRLLKRKSRIDIYS